MKITRRRRAVEANTEVLQPYMTGDAVDLKQGEQEFSSKDTAVNGKQGNTPAVFKAVRDKIGWQSGTINLDYGGVTEDADAVADTFFEPLGVTNVIYDKFNQTSEHNQAVIRFLRSQGGADTATLSNVLNVIKEIHIRREVLEDVYSLLKPNGVLYAYVHEGSKADQEQGARQTTKGWQNFRKTGDYLDEIHEVFPGAYVKYGILICPKSAGAAKTAASTDIQNDSLVFV